MAISLRLKELFRILSLQKSTLCYTFRNMVYYIICVLLARKQLYLLVELTKECSFTHTNRYGGGGGAKSPPDISKKLKKRHGTRTKKLTKTLSTVKTLRHSSKMG